MPPARMGQVLPVPPTVMAYGSGRARPAPNPVITGALDSQLEVGLWLINGPAALFRGSQDAVEWSRRWLAVGRDEG